MEVGRPFTSAGSDGRRWCSSAGQRCRDGDAGKAVHGPVTKYLA